LTFATYSCGIEDDRESGQLLLDLVEDIEPDLGLGAGREFVGTVRRSDGDSQRVDTGLLDEVLDLLGLGVGVLLGLDIVLDARKNAELTLDGDVVGARVSELDDLLREGDILLVREMRPVDHDGAEAELDAVLADLERVAVVEMQHDRDHLVLRMDFPRIFDRALGEKAQDRGVRVLPRAGRDLEDHRRLGLDACGDDSLELLHLGEVVPRNRVAASHRLRKDVLRVDKAESLVRHSH
jgi:hypothetical protein